MSKYKKFHRPRQPSQEDQQRAYDHEQHLSRYTNAIWMSTPSDKKGHSEAVGTKVPGRILHAIHVVLQSSRFPYRTISDFLRHAVIRHLEYLNSMEDIPRSPICRLIAQEQILALEEQKARYEHNMQRLQELVMELTNKGTPEARQKAISIVLQQLELLKGTEDPYYRQLFIGRVRANYQDLLNSVPCADFSEMSDEKVEDEEGELAALMAQMEEMEQDGEEK